MLDFFCLNDKSITRAEQLSGLLLAYTAIIIFWYTYETYKLRVLTESNNYGLLDIDHKNTSINFAGLTVVRPESEQKFINIDLFVTNIGKGSLKILKAEISSRSYRGKKNPNLKIDKYPFIQNQNLSVQDTVRMDFLLEVDKWYEGVTDFALTIQYEDINGIYEQVIEFSDVNLGNGGKFNAKSRSKITIKSKR